MAVKRTNDPAFSGFLQSAAATLTPTGDFSVATWVKFATSVNTKGIWSCGNGQDDLWLRTDATGILQLRQGLNFGYGNRLTASAAFSLGVWYFVAMTKSGATVTLYVGDETNAAAAVASGSSSGWGSPIFTAGGQRLFHGRGEGDQLGANSEMEHCRSWDGLALSLAQINAERGSAVPVMTTNLRADYRLESAATRGVDSSGNGFALTDGGSTTWADGVGPTLPGASATGVNLRRSGYLGGRQGGAAFGQGW